MSIHTEAEVLREVWPFRALANQKLKLLAFVSQIEQYKAGETIIHQGDPGDAAFVLIDGHIDVTITADGISRRGKDMGRHAFFGEIAVIKNTIRAATVTARTDVVVLRIAKDALQQMIVEEPELGQRIADHIETAGYNFS